MTWTDTDLSLDIDPSKILSFGFRVQTNDITHPTGAGHNW